MCAANLSEGRDNEVLGLLRSAAGDQLVDVHVDADHHRCVLTLVGAPDDLVASVLSLGAEAVRSIDLAAHRGVHPRLGAIDVVPFAPLAGSDLAAAVGARERAIAGLAALGVPVFRFGPLPDGTTRSLPEVRRQAFAGLQPDAGPPVAHPSAGAAAVGARLPLLAWNAWIQGATLDATRQVAASIRADAVRALGFEVLGATQVSCNLLAPARVTPKDVYLAIEASLPVGAHVVRCELVGLVGDAVLAAVPSSWWERLDLSADRSVEAAARRVIG